MLFLLRLKVWKKWLSSLAEEVRADVAADVAAVAVVLDLDDLGAEVGEVRGAERAGAVLLDGEHAQARQGKAGSGVGHESLGCWDGSPRGDRCAAAPFVRTI